MPVFHFNVRDGIDIPDVIGRELPSLREARREAVLFGGRLFKAYPEIFLGLKKFRIEVADDAGSMLFSVCVSTGNRPRFDIRYPRKALGPLWLLPRIGRRVSRCRLFRAYGNRERRELSPKADQANVRASESLQIFAELSRLLHLDDWENR